MYPLDQSAATKQSLVLTDTGTEGPAPLGTGLGNLGSWVRPSQGPCVHREELIEEKEQSNKKNSLKDNLKRTIEGREDFLYRTCAGKPW